jgi:hypothetical protein
MQIDLALALMVSGCVGFMGFIAYTVYRMRSENDQ